MKNQPSPLAYSFHTRSMLSAAQFALAQKVEEETSRSVFVHFGWTDSELVPLVRHFIPCTRGSEEHDTEPTFPHFMDLGGKGQQLWFALYKRAFTHRQHWLRTSNLDEHEAFLLSKIKEKRNILGKTHKLNFGFSALQPFSEAERKSVPCQNHNVMYLVRQQRTAKDLCEKPTVPVIGGYYRGVFCLVPTLKKIGIAAPPKQHNNSYVIVVPRFSAVDGGTHHRHDSRKALLNLDRLRTIRTERKRPPRGAEDHALSRKFHLMCLLHFRVKKEEELVVLQMWAFFRLLQVVWLLRCLQTILVGLTTPSISSTSGDHAPKQPDVEDQRDEIPRCHTRYDL